MFPESHTRRRFLGLSGVAALGLVVAACGGSSGTAAVTEVPVDNGEDALGRLLEGNDRFVADKTRPVNVGKDRRAKLVKRERPFALVFSCVDSRVPAELVFDRGLGDLYVVSTAAEVLDQAVLATIEYGVTDLEIPLVVVLGHSGCSFVSGAVATLASGEGPSPEIGQLRWNSHFKLIKSRQSVRQTSFPCNPTCQFEVRYGEEYRTQ